ncbi:10899_t:CDS:2 [Gigaspora margarita]|uniref:10899_t:CDS:1 n=1 Tax=Gigaspora margarita TaxID=4874 RepID=A0ABN7WMY0_GIGMA|nr:10899_t:CDS:2 [Gigaspora margarita]
MSENQINEAVYTLKNSGNYTPLMTIVTTHVSEILEIDINAHYNKKICGALIERVRSVEFGIRILLRRKSEIEENFKKSDYLDNFENFTKTLIDIKKFVANITQFQRFKFFKADEVKENFLQLTKKFDACMNVLGFAMLTDQEKLKQIDDESLQDDLNEMTEFIGYIECYQEYREVSTPNELIEIPIIHPTKLQDPSNSLQANKHPTILKKKLLPDNREVACKSFLHDVSQFKNTLEILIKASLCPKILKFYGISKIDNNNYLIFEWAEMGNLKEVYEKYSITWTTKISFALDIFRAILFLDSHTMFHHDIRCENVLVTSKLESKLTNFRFARMKDDVTNYINQDRESLRWMAPEKMLDYEKENIVRYTYKCELFSFGMLLWELAFEKTPYDGKNLADIITHVTKGGREEIPVYSSDELEEAKICQEFTRIIKDVWAHEPGNRISPSKLFIELSNLKNKYTTDKLTMPLLEKKQPTT